ncbi:MAG: hypothetical protein RLZZ324_1249 [Candidatus Parcubacteria bacterium]
MKRMHAAYISAAVLCVILGALALSNSRLFGPPADGGPADGGPAAPAVTPVQGRTLGTAATLAIGESVTFADGPSVTLVRIDDSRCAKGNTCIWQGELSPVLRLSGGGFDTPREVRLGTVTAKRASAGGFDISLTDATAVSITFTITKSEAYVMPVHSQIRVTAPAAGAVVTSPLTVSGEAKGTWYFEASFPVKLLDADGSAVAVGHATAKSDWMTESFVPFDATLTWTAVPKGPTGTLVLEKDNPSDRPESADSFRYTVRFTSVKP